jgi:predicted TIM-barrel fold metal-dependent hydrolase
MTTEELQAAWTGIAVDAQIHLWAGGTPGGTHQHAPFGVHDALAGMDAAGVDACVVVPPPWDPDANAIAVEAARSHPERFAVMANLPLDERTGRPMIEAWREQREVMGLRLAFSQDPQRRVLLDNGADWIWPLAARAALPVMIFAPDLLPAIGDIARRNPGLAICVDHMGLVTGTKDDAAFEPVLPELLSLAERANVSIKLSSAPIYSSEPYPFANVSGYLEQIVDAFGPARCFWGTDITRMPCSWRECLTHFTETLPWLTGGDKDLVMGEALCTWLRWDAPLLRRAQSAAGPPAGGTA